MDNATCHVVYVNRQVRQDRLIRNDATDAHLSNGDVASGEVEYIQKDAALLLDTFGEGMQSMNPSFSLVMLTTLRQSTSVPPAQHASRRFSNFPTSQ